MRSLQRKIAARVQQRARIAERDDGAVTDEDLAMYRRFIKVRDEALEEAHDALRPNASNREKNNARAAIEDILPQLQQ